MAVTIPAAAFQLLNVGVQALCTKMLLHIERGDTEEEIQKHIDEMTAMNNATTAELELLRSQNP